MTCPTLSLGWRSWLTRWRVFSIGSLHPLYFECISLRVRTDRDRVGRGIYAGA
jgi:hypothetical protein